ncbi:hypothetical protein KKG83_01150 [Candidatus Micrarchaeota archaeon]|nr:hypothetical protein [Candidatus Micrarchaeota archaeon]MBU2476056.1 hypothetical protein [Candidatus Micrarchaeota archaeon]
MKAKEFWHESLTEESWKKLQELSKETELTVIGGWAVWLWTKQHKSKDIYIIVDFKELTQLKEKYSLEKNDRLKKYEIKMQGFDIDVYVSFYSRLALQIEELLKEKVRIEGINTIPCEALLILKQGAEIDGRNTIKGQKDLIDLLTLLVYAPIDFKKYFGLLKQHNKTEYAKELVGAITRFNTKDSEKYLGINFKEFSKKKKQLMEQIKNARTTR